MPCGAGPEIAWVISEFEEVQPQCSTQEDHHQNHTTSGQKAFSKDVQSLAETIEELGNPFLEWSTDLLDLDTKEISDQSALKTVEDARMIGQNCLGTSPKSASLKEASQ